MTATNRRDALPPNADPWVHQRGALLYLDISRTALHHLRTSGELEPDGFDRGGRPVWRFSTLEAYAARTISTAPKPRAGNRNLLNLAGAP